MKFIIRLSLLFLISCTDHPTATPAQKHGAQLKMEIDPVELESDFIKWWTYHSSTISLPSQFKALNAEMDTITKGEFLQKLSTGQCIPLALTSDDIASTYLLHELSSNADERIARTMKNEAMIQSKHYNMEGTQLPEYTFTDLNGNVYTNESTLGKTIILKTWFVNCQACIAEFPELNEFVEKYEHREDILFLSLALDSEEELRDFLATKAFAYEVVADQDLYIQDELGLQIYPTHIIIDKEGKIQKVVNKASEMVEFFERKENIPNHEYN